MARAAKVSNGPAALRRPKLAASELHFGSVAVSVLPPASRVSLRAPSTSLPSLSEALRVELPKSPKNSATASGRTALWLGPDEWLIIAEASDDPLADLAGVEALHSAIDVSHRNVAFAVSGPDADPDSDGATNRHEFLSGTDPRDSASVLRVRINTQTNTAIIQFTAGSNRAFTLQYRDHPGLGTWLELTNIAPVNSNRTIVCSDPFPVGVSNRFYRVSAL